MLSRNSLGLLTVGLMIPLVLSAPWLGVELWRVWWVRVALLICIGIVLLTRAREVGGERGWTWSGLTWPGLRAWAMQHWLLVAICAWFLWNSTASLLGGSWETAVFGNPHRADGLFSLSVILTGSILVTASWAKRGSRYLEILATRYSILVIALITLVVVTGALISAGLQGALAVYEYARLGIGNSNLMAGVLVTAMPWLLVRLWRFRTWVGVGAWLVVTILLSILGSIAGSVISGVVGVTLLAMLSTKKSGIVIACLGVGVMCAALSRQFPALIQLQNLSSEGRVQIYSTLIEASMQRPILGWGWAGVSRAYQAQIDPQLGIYAALELDKAHGSWLEQLVAAGFPGLVLLWVVQAGVVLHAVSACQKSQGVEREFWLAACASIFAYLVFSQTNVTSVHQEVFFWLTAGLVLWHRHLVSDLLQ